MKISIKDLKRIIKEEIGKDPWPGIKGNNPPGSLDGESIMGRVDAEIMALAQALAVEICRGENPGEPDVGEVDGYLPEVENAVRDAIENVIMEFL